MPLKFAEPTDGAIPLSLIFSDQFEGWRDGLDAAARAWVDASGFRGDPGAALALPAADGSLRAAVGGLGASAMPRRDPFLAARIRAALPDGTYVLAASPSGEDLDEVALGWLLGGYAFSRYRDQKPPKAQLVAPDGVAVARLVHIAAGEALTRDLINTPSSDMATRMRRCEGLSPSRMSGSARETMTDIE